MDRGLNSQTARDIICTTWRDRELERILTCTARGTSQAARGTDVQQKLPVLNKMKSGLFILIIYVLNWLFLLLPIYN